MKAHFSRLEFEPGRTYGASAVNKAHMTLTNMFNRLEDWKEDGWVGGHNISGLALPRRNPGLLVKRLKEPARDRYITPMEYRCYYKIARQLGFDEIASAIRFAIWSHLAPIDLFELNDKEIDEGAWLIRVYRRHTKTDQNPMGSLQIVHLTEKMWAVINRQRQFRAPNEKRIFIITNRRRNLAKIRKIARQNGYPDFSWRDLRKAGSGYLHGKGVDRQTRADILGHGDPRVTDTYYTPPGNPRARVASRMVQEAFK
jgi:integrase